jgi:xanthine dehydrogenase YagR molybdenum-binding subunit
MASATSSSTSAVGIREREPAIGQPLDRIDGKLKVSGGATYAYEYGEGGKPAYGFILGAAIGKGRIVEIDTTEAEGAPGVLLVLTHKNAPPQPEFGATTVEPPARTFERPRPVLAGDRISHYDEPVALVVASTFEAARSAAGLIKVNYQREIGAFDLKANVGDAYQPRRLNAGIENETALGDFNAAFASAPVRTDVTYTLPYENHNPMEPHATVAAWSGDQLTLYTSTQTVASIRTGVANTLQIPPDRIRVVTPYVGGGFGSKLIVHCDVVLAAMAARLAQRPVKVALTRQQMFGNTGHRPMFVQQVRLGAETDGRLTAIAHEVLSSTARTEEFAEQTAAASRSLYAAPNRLTRGRLVRLDTHRGEWMRAPGEAPGLLAIECAMDELAERVGLDPIELRVRNEPDQDPERKVPFSSRNLVGCMREGARRFGWERRPTKPASMRDGKMLVGYGMAASIRPNYLRPSQAAVEISNKGEVTARLDMTDIGTGTYTILTQIAADGLGVPVSAVKIELGDSRFPRTPGSGGSFGAASAGGALHNACATLRQKIAQAAIADSNSTLRGANAAEVSFAHGEVRIGDRSENLAALLERIAPQGLAAEGSIAPGDTYRNFSQHAFGAHFAEVGVDADTGEVRLRRMLGMFAAGRILNPKTARSQMIGGMIWGVGMALMEEGVMDARYGQFINHDLAEYHVATNADVPDVDAVFIDEQDDKGNPLGSKGIGELGICGAGAAVANAVYNATGVRVREFPITLDKLLSKMPAPAI